MKMKKNEEVTNDLISVIIPVYNGEKYLPKLLDSLLNQTYKNFEIIFGYDEKSTDDSLVILQKFQKEVYENHNVIIDIGRDNGVGGGRNRGLKLAKGKYISFIDADDYLMPEYLEYLHDGFIQHPDADISNCRCVMLLPGEDEKNVLKAASDTSKHIIEVADKNKMLSSFIQMSAFDYKSNLIISAPAVWLYMIRREHIISHNHFFLDSTIKKDGGIIEDVVWIMKLFLFTNKFVYTNRILYMYRIHQGSVLSSSNQMIFINSLNATRNYLKKDLDEVDPRLSVGLKDMFLPFAVIRNIFAKTYEDWLYSLKDVFEIPSDVKDMRKELENVKLVSVNPYSELNNLLINEFNTNKHRCYVLARNNWINCFSKKWKIYPLTDTIPQLTEEEKKIARDLENDYPQYLKY